MARTARTLYCKIPGCGRPHYALDFCNGHWRRFHQYGDPMGGRPISYANRTNFDDWWESDGRHATPDKCLIWPTAPAGEYGPHARVTKKAHGPKPDPNMLSAHSCGNGRGGCVNYHHLRWATYKENAQDLMMHRLVGIAPKLAPAKLSDHQVMEILSRSDEKGAALAAEYGVSRSLITRIRKGERRGDVEKFRPTTSISE